MTFFFFVQQCSQRKIGSLGGGMAHEIQCRQMSLYESDKAPPPHKQIVRGYLLHNQVLKKV